MIFGIFLESHIFALASWSSELRLNDLFTVLNFGYSGLIGLGRTGLVIPMLKRCNKICI